MNMLKNAMAAGLVATLLAACAELPPPTAALLTYQTDPAGAKIFEGTQDLGVAPVTRKYELDTSKATAAATPVIADGKTATITTPDVTAVWPSGAKTTYFTVLPVGADRVATLTRPPGAPGLDTDLANAKRLTEELARDAQRRKEEQARDVARASDRCKAQQAGGSLAVANDCM